MQNFGFVREGSVVCGIDSQSNVVPAHNENTDVAIPLTNSRSRFHKLWSSYQWRMRHYFYIHLSIFFINALLSGMIVWAIEGKQVHFIDCWFISATCVFTCGLQTYPFASFSRSSQIILLIFTLISGITVSTIPAIIIKIYRIKTKRGTKNTEGFSSSSSSIVENDTLPLRQFVRHNSSDPVLNKHLQSLPNPEHLRVTAYIILIILIFLTCFIIYLFSFLSIGFWLKYHYDPKDFSQSNVTINPFYASLVISVTGFNQNGLTVWENGAFLFVTDIFLNIIIMIIVMSGTSLFPAILRGVVTLVKSLMPWKYKIYFDYILINNHRLSTVIFPSIQTRLYVTITIFMQILGVTVALILDFNNPNLAMYGGGQRFMIFMFQTVNTRFGGYATIDISELAAATLVIFVLLMGIKPQMLCTINETPFEMEWILLQTEDKVENKISNPARRPSIDLFLPVNQMKDYLLRQGSLTKAQAKTYFTKILRTDRAETAINHYNKKLNQRRMSSGSSNTSSNSLQISILRMKLLLIIFCRHFILALFSLIISTRTWLFIFVFLICAFEAPLVTPSNPTITVFRIIFEVLSAFGGCGLSMGFSSSTSTSLAAVFSTPSKMIIIFTMCMGRHRGLLDSMKDQEEIEYSAQTLIDSWRQLAVYEQRQRKTMEIDEEMPTISIKVIPPTPKLSTRF